MIERNRAVLRRLVGTALTFAALTLAAWGIRNWWQAGEEFRRPLAPAAQPGPEHVQVDCAALPRKRLWVVMVLGQSNSANHAESRASGGPAVLSWYDGRCYEARDPLPGASGDGGSLWTRLGPSLIAAGAAERVLFVPMGITATSVAQWERHPMLTARLEATTRALRAAQLTVTHVIWYQGEADSFKGTSGAEYRHDFGRVLARLRSLGVDAPVYVSMATMCQKRSNPSVRSVQQALPNELPGVRGGPDMDSLFGPVHRYNGCHFGSASATLAAKAWQQALMQPDS